MENKESQERLEQMHRENEALHTGATESHRCYRFSQGGLYEH